VAKVQINIATFQSPQNMYMFVTKILTYTTSNKFTRKIYPWLIGVVDCESGSLELLGFDAENKKNPSSPLMACKYSPLEIPRGRYDKHSSKFSLSYETKVYRTSGRKPNFRR
jgi:hypothetical protein